MKRVIPIWLLYLVSAVAFSQTDYTSNKYRDSLQLVLSQKTNDTIRGITLYNLAYYYLESNRDSALFFIEPALVLAKKLNQPCWIAKSLVIKSYVVSHLGNLPLAFKLANEALVIAQDEKNEKNVYIEKGSAFAGDPHQYRLDVLTGVFHRMADLYSDAGNNQKAIAYYKEAIQVAELLKYKPGLKNSTFYLVNSTMNIGAIYSEMDKLDSAQLYSKKALDNANITGYKVYLGYILSDIGRIYFKRKQLDSASQYYLEALSVSKKQNNVASEANVNIFLARLYESRHQADSMMYYAKAALSIGTNLKVAYLIRTSTAIISSAYQLQGNTDSAFTYLTISQKLGDSLNNDWTEKLTQFQNINFEEQLRLEKVEQDNLAYKNKIRTIALFTGLGLLSVLTFIFYRNNRQKQKANIVLQNQKQEIENTLAQLKATQSQLIQSEKMASLGELTAGIAHEIQNPLNFVNNFSEVNKELLVEMKDEMNKGNIDDANAIANDVIDNEEKIIHHGKRADAIVKGMLQHSQSSSGLKEPTDINKLADEYLRLAYHGLRAKDKSFNATLKTEFDESIGNINIIPQDIGRVILNLINNAFYAVQIKQREAPPEGLTTFQKLSTLYEPTVSISTKKMDGKVLISVKDNGNGIPQKVLDKIFQPFFTTKPTGQGTGLGLSLAYDIVKAHGGELKVETKEARPDDPVGRGEGSEFIILLPIV